MKNARMLFKWWWRFSKEDNPLWKKVVMSCNNLSVNRPMSMQLKNKTGSPWSSIASIWDISNEVKDVVMKGLWIMVGDRNNTLFWEDLWIGDQSLKEKFPRLFSISCLRERSIAECGFWDGCVWNWSLQWRRQFFEWERNFLNDLHDLLVQVVLNAERSDHAVWRPHCSGQYSVKSFISSVASKQNNTWRIKIFSSTFGKVWLLQEWSIGVVCYLGQTLHTRSA